MKKVTLQLETLTCPSCLVKIEAGLNKIDGVENIKILFNASKVKAEYDETKVQVGEIKSVIEKLGYDVLSVK